MPSFSEPTADWSREIPRYRVTRETLPAEKARFRFESPFTDQSSADRWQYGTQALKAGSEISTREWPHASFYPLNESARRIHAFFTIAQKSRMARAPYDQSGRLQLSDGLAGPTQPKFSIKTGATAA